MDKSVTCDIFCNVIDNYGDIGVSWRLARQLANEFGLNVRMWVDDLASFAKLCPEADAKLETQRCRGVEVRRWNKEFSEVQPAELVIEAFGCTLPESYIAAMVKISIHSDRSAKMDARRQGLVERDSTGKYSEEDEAAANNAGAPLIGRKSVWINLEYLSAEDWVEGCHKLPSPKPPLTRYFFFPGFTKKTGGLLLERDLLARRDVFQSDVSQQQAFWQSIGMQMPAADTLKISLFAYENDALAGLFDAWAEGEQPVLCLVPEGRILPQVVQYFAGQDLSRHGEVVGINPDLRNYVRGNLRVRVLPFVEQERYDELLWACDINFVRGEDSCVRAQWAGKPFVWQIYPQHDEVHWEKLQAFLDLYDVSLDPAASQAMQGLWRVWNGGEISLVGQNPDTSSVLPAWQAASTGSGQAASTKPLVLSSVEGSGQAASTGSGQAWLAFAAARGELSLRAQGWAQELSANNLALNLLDFFQEIGRICAFKIEEQ